jgi:hypothetical protein
MGARFALSSSVIFVPLWLKVLAGYAASAASGAGFLRGVGT